MYLYCQMSVLKPAPPVFVVLLHTVPWARRTGAGFGLLGEQGVRSIHAQNMSMYPQQGRQAPFYCQRAQHIHCTIIMGTIPQPHKRNNHRYRHFTPVFILSCQCVHVLVNTVQTTLCFICTRIPSRRKSVATVPYNTL